MTKGVTAVGVKFSKTTGLPIGIDRNPKAKAVYDLMVAGASKEAALMEVVGFVPSTTHAPTGVHGDVSEYVETRTKEEILDDQHMRFEVLEKMVEATARGLNRALIVSGAAGVGKTFDTERVLNGLEGELDLNIVKLSGRCTAAALYLTMHENRYDNSVIVLDDIDSVFEDEDALNILKAALDTGDKRVVSWATGTGTRMVDADGEQLEASFEFEGSVIFLSNLDFDAIIRRGSKIGKHIAALCTRVQHIEMGINTAYEKMIRLEDKAEAVFTRQGVESDDDILNAMIWLEDNFDRLRDVSLRTLTKLAGLIKMGAGWERIASVTLCK